MTASGTARGGRNGSRAAERRDGVERGADRAPGEEYVVDQHDDGAGEVERDAGDGFGQHRAQAVVVAVEGAVERAGGDLHRLDLLQRVGQAAGDGDAAGLQSHEHDVVEAVVVLDDLVRHAPDRPLDV